LATTLIRLYYREGDYKSGWWGTRPDTSGPYFDRAEWSESSKIAAATRDLYASADAGLRRHIEQQLARHHVKLEGLAAPSAPSEPQAEMTGPIELPKVDPNNKNQIANMPFEEAAARALKTPGDAKRGKLLFTAQSCVACHTVAEGQTPKGPHLVDIGKRYKRAELIESVLKPSAKIAQGFDTYSFVTIDGKILQGFVVSESAEAIELRQTDGVAKTLPTDEIDERVKQEVSMMPNGVVGNLTPEQLADLLAYLESLRSK
jgi:putative heme-binding domain-containing protein